MNWIKNKIDRKRRRGKTDMVYTEVPSEKFYEKLEEIPQIRIREIEKFESTFGIWIFEHARTDFDAWIFMDLLDVLGMDNFVNLVNLVEPWGILFEQCSGTKISDIFVQVNKFKDIVKAVFSAKEKYKYIKDMVADYGIEIEGFSYWHDDKRVLFKLILPIAFHVDYLSKGSSSIFEEYWEYIGAVIVSWDLRRPPYIQEYHLVPVFEDRREKLVIVEREKNTPRTVFDYHSSIYKRLEERYIIDISERKLSDFLKFYKNILVKKFLFDEGE